MGNRHYEEMIVVLGTDNRREAIEIMLSLLFFVVSIIYFLSELKKYKNSTKSERG